MKVTPPEAVLSAMRSIREGCEDQSSPASLAIKQIREGLLAKPQTVARMKAIVDGFSRNAGFNAVQGSFRAKRLGKQPTAEQGRKTARGRRLGSGLNDDALIDKMHVLVTGSNVLPTAAAKAVAHEAEGASSSSTIDRLRRKYGERYEGKVYAVARRRKNRG